MLSCILNHYFFIIEGCLGQFCFKRVKVAHISTSILLLCSKSNYQDIKIFHKTHSLKNISTQTFIILMRNIYKLVRGNYEIINSTKPSTSSGICLEVLCQWWVSKKVYWVIELHFEVFNSSATSADIKFRFSRFVAAFTALKVKFGFNSLHYLNRYTPHILKANDLKEILNLMNFIFSSLSISAEYSAIIRNAGIRFSNTNVLLKVNIPMIQAVMYQQPSSLIWHFQFYSCYVLFCSSCPMFVIVLL